MNTTLDAAGRRRSPATYPDYLYLEGIDAGEIIETVHGRRAPLIPAATALLR